LSIKPELPLVFKYSYNTQPHEIQKDSLKLEEGQGSHLPPCTCGTRANLNPSRSLSLFFPVSSPAALPLLMKLYFSIHSKTIHIKVIDDKAYEKNKNYVIEMMGPRMVDMSVQKGVVPCPPH
jgi:hypothetical protein